MSTSTTSANLAPADDKYDDFLHGLQAQLIASLEQSTLFRTDAEGLFDAYLASIPAEYRQHYTCSCCRAFVNNFGGLVTIDEQGRTAPALWSFDAPSVHKPAVEAMARIVRRAQVIGPFISSEKEWGKAEAGGFVHMHVTPPASLVYQRTTLTAGQKMAEKREDFGNVARALAEFTKEHIAVALKLIQTDSLYQSEKVLGVAQFLADLHTARDAAQGNEAKANILWRAIGTAPAGFCHPRSSMIGTLLEDIAAGMSFEQVSRRFADKMHPLRYMRPQAAPTAGNIAQAEKLFEQLGLAPALERRIARTDEVPLLWRPKQAEQKAEGKTGIFGHLAPKAKAAASNIEIPAITMTARKFVETVIPTADQIDLHLNAGNTQFIVLTAAVNADAPRLFQWEHGYAWYCWSAGAPASQYGLATGWAKMNGITRLPARWNDDGERFKHHGDGLVLLVEGARETRESSAALFPSLLRSELHGARATIEAHSKSAKMQGLKDGTAIGYDLRQGSSTSYPVQLRVHTNGSTQVYKIDRWD